jgi:annexin A7/11
MFESKSFDCRKTERMFMIALEVRWEDQLPGQVSNLLSSDLRELKSALGTVSTDEVKVCSILLNRSPAYLNQLQAQFLQAHGKTLTKMIKKNFSGHMESALLYAVEGGKKDINGAWRAAKWLEKSMKGMGTKDEQLIYRILRASWDYEYLTCVKEAYRAKYKKTLRDRVKGETSGKYRDMLLTIIGNN